MKVFITFDTEIWCDGWADLDAKFPAAFDRYVYGQTKRGRYAIPFIVDVLNDHGLTGVFFVEPLFSMRFGAGPLQELVGLIEDARQEVQLHLHTEWLDVASPPLIPGLEEKRRFLRDFTYAEQVRILAKGRDLLQEAGAQDINAFRAGNYAANLDSLRALAEIGIVFDSSYNFGSACGVADMAAGRVLTQPETLEGVIEYPITVFSDGLGSSFRHLQLTACSFAEIAEVLNTAHDAGWEAVVVVAHNFELLTPAKDRADSIVVRRFVRLCEFLSRHPERFQVCGFRNLQEAATREQLAPVASRRSLTYGRLLEQSARRLLY